MRELKFRAWDNLKKEWLKKKVYHFNPHFNDEGIGEFRLPQHPAGHTIQQFTGLKDKKGIEIYEGDIVEAVHFVFDFKYKDNERPENYSGTIRWHHSYWAIGDYKLFVMEDDSLNVIGNIFENPELLK